VASWLRAAFKIPITDGIESSTAHFVKGEPGFRDNFAWPDEASEIAIKKLSVRIETQWPEYAPVRQRIQNLADRSTIKVTWVDGEHKNTASDFDLKIMGSKIRQGRHLWTQEILDFANYSQELQKYPLTFAKLQNTRKKSASSVPIDNETLQDLEKAAFNETSIVPIGRYKFHLFSRKNSPISLEFNELGIDTFVLRKN
jgi:hypothetical protein